jgi:hypothetical protein
MSESVITSPALAGRINLIHSLEFASSFALLAPRKDEVCSEFASPAYCVVAKTKFCSGYASLVILACKDRRLIRYSYVIKSTTKPSRAKIYVLTLLRRVSFRVRAIL